MNHDPLWAPWRLGYILGEDQPATDQRRATRELPPGGDRDCFICRAAAENTDRENLVVDRGEHCLTILNRYPYNNGHLLVAPAAHKAQLNELSDAEALECTKRLSQWVDTLSARMKAEGFNIGLNLGKVAGAGLPGHLHWHLVPRWNGDTNFMPALAGIKVIPQSLDALWELLHDAAQGG